MKRREQLSRSEREKKEDEEEEEEDDNCIKWTESVGGAKWTACGRGQEGMMSARGGRASFRRDLGAERRQRGGKHQHFGLHEGQIGQTCDHFGRLLAQVLLFPRLPVKQEVTKQHQASPI